MLSIRLLSIGVEDYYLALAAEDYYIGGGEPPGVWVGRGAQMLALSGTVQPEHFRSLFRGFDPHTGLPLVQNAGAPRRQAGWDTTYSAPKTVSVLWSQAPPELRQRIERIQQRAVAATMEFADNSFGCSRTGAGGAETVPAHLVAAMFEHGTSRAGDPQLHTHCIVLNVGVSDDGTTRTILSRPFYQNKMLLGALYRAHLAHHLQAELGLATERHGNLFELAGVPNELARKHSKRRAEVLRRLAEKGFSGGRAAAIATLETRRRKKDVLPRSQLFPAWRKVNEEHGFTERSVQELLGQVTPRPETAVQETVRQAVRNLTKQKTHFGATDLLTETLCEAARLGLSPATIPEAVQAHIQESPDCLPIPTVDGTVRYTTTAIVNEEEHLLVTLSKMSQRAGLTVPKKAIDKLLAERPTIRTDQAVAVRHLTQGKGAVRVVRGLAGTGKTFMLKTCLQAWQRQGYRVIGAAPTGKAAQVLSQETGIDANTITMRLGDYTLPLSAHLKHHAEQLGWAAKRELLRAAGQWTTRPGKKKRRKKNKAKAFPFKQPQPVPIDSKTILVVDEAGMVNTRHMRMLLDLVEKGGGTLVLIGDPAQLAPVEGGAPFRSLSERVGFAELTEITRQEETWAQEAVQLFARGEPGKALAMYVKKNLVRVRQSKDEALQQLALDWTAVGLTTPERAAVIVATNEDSETANQLCQAHRIKVGCLDASQHIEIFDEDKERKTSYTNRVHVGDRVIFTRNSKKYGVQNGSLGTVVAINQLRGSIAVELDSATTVIVPVKAFPHIRLGYAMTAYKAQGATFKECFVMLGGASQDLPTSYVEASRSKLTTRFYAETSVLNEYLEEVEDSPLAAQMKRRPDLFLASDLFAHHKVIEQDRQRLIQRLLSDWQVVVERDPQNTAIITETEDEARQINEHCHALLRAGIQLPDLSKDVSTTQAASIAQPVAGGTEIQPKEEQVQPTPAPTQAVKPAPTVAPIRVRPVFEEEQQPQSQASQADTVSQQTVSPEQPLYLRWGDVIYGVGDRIRFNKDSYFLSIREGDIGILQKVNPDQLSITVMLHYGVSVTVPLHLYQDISQGWALSQSQASGLKLKNALVLQEHPQKQATTPSDFFAWHTPSPGFQLPPVTSQSTTSSGTISTLPQSNNWQAAQTDYYTQFLFSAGQYAYTQKIEEANRLAFQQAQAAQAQAQEQVVTQRYRIAQSWY